jgi:hypothetical protein
MDVTPELCRDLIWILAALERLERRLDALLEALSDGVEGPW